MSDSQIRVLRGATFAVSDRCGDMRADGDAASGLYFRDVRHLSHWTVRLDGRRLTGVRGESVSKDEAVFLLSERTDSLDVPPALILLRHRRVDQGMVEVLRLASHDQQPRTVQLTVVLDADFADVMELDQSSRRGHRYHHATEGRLTLGYERETFRRSTVITAEGAFITPRSLTFIIELPPGQVWEREIRLSVVDSSEDSRPAADDDDWLATAPSMDSVNDHLRNTYHHSLADLTALQCETAVGDLTVPGAGLPKYMALFGRDSLITAYQALPFLPEIGRNTLVALAAHQATGFDDPTDAEPGKILHELRLGEVVHFGEQPYGPYYGTADATPLFLILLDEYERWTGDLDTVRGLEPAARRAVGWLQRHADRDDLGFITYRTRNPAQGLRNHGWKDSDDAIAHPDGQLVEPPLALCEVQGYAYDALRRTARLARHVWNDERLSQHLEQEANELRTRFIEAFWLPDSGYYALALDRDHQPVRTLTSNIGHLLWSGIVPEPHVDSLARHLMGERLFSGWGVRTVAEGQPVYNPMGYHTGTVWPHDSAIAAAGLARYGHRAEAVRLVDAGLTAAAHMDHRLPEALVGIPRSVTRIPITLPGATWPHSWSCGAPLLMLRVLLGLEPTSDGPTVVATGPDEPFGEITLRGLAGRWGRADVTQEAFGRTAPGAPRDVAADHL